MVGLLSNEEQFKLKDVSIIFFLFFSLLILYINIIIIILRI
jgi:hypothetical protein